MRIALIGTRGVPANYGGFETCVEEVGSRLADRGHDVTVYCRSNNYNKHVLSYKGMQLVYLPSLKRKSLDTLTHTLLSVVHSLFKSYDVLMVFNAANSPVLLLPRLFNKKIAINTDGLEWKRGKWGATARFYYKFSEWFATKITNRIVADSRGIQDYYRQSYGVDSSFIAYGAYISKSKNPDLLHSMGLKAGEYFLQITRFEPENNPLLTIQAYKKLNCRKKLVIVGGVPFPSEYSRQIEKEASDKILLPGPIYENSVLRELWCNCYAYIHGNEVGGTNPALLQTMASGCFTIAIDVSFSKDVLKDCGIYFCKSVNDLADKMVWSIENEEDLDEYKVRAVQRIIRYYNWDDVAESYETLFSQLKSGKYAWPISKTNVTKKRHDMS